MRGRRRSSRPAARPRRSRRSASRGGARPARTRSARACADSRGPQPTSASGPGASCQRSPSASSRDSSCRLARWPRAVPSSSGAQRSRASARAGSTTRLTTTSGAGSSSTSSSSRWARSLSKASQASTSAAAIVAPAGRRLAEDERGRLARRETVVEVSQHLPCAALVGRRVEAVATRRAGRCEQPVTRFPRPQHAHRDADPAAERPDAQETWKWCGHQRLCCRPQRSTNPGQRR